MTDQTKLRAVVFVETAAGETRILEVVRVERAADVDTHHGVVIASMQAEIARRLLADNILFGSRIGAFELEASPYERPRLLGEGDAP